MAAHPKAFIIHGRDRVLRDALRTFLESLGLEPVDFDLVRAKLGGAISAADVIREGMQRTQLAIALLDPEDYVSLDPHFRDRSAASNDVRWQARPNVIFEAGMAFALNRSRVLFVRTLDLPPFTDLLGIHFIDLSNALHSRALLKDAIFSTLKEQDIEISGRGDDWRTAGNFERISPPITPLDPFGTRPWRDWFSCSGTALLASTSMFELAALIGGFAWNFLWNALGGQGKEPHGGAAFLWPMVSLLPVVVAVVAAGHYFRRDAWQQQASRYAWFLGSAGLGSWFFYDLPLAGQNGFRDLLASQPFLAKERLLVLLWSLSLSMLSLVPFDLPARLRPRMMTRVYPWRVLFVMCSTSVPVIAFVQIFRGPEHDSARGILAGLLLRTSLAVALFSRPNG